MSNSAEITSFSEFLSKGLEKDEKDNNLHDSLYMHELTEKIEGK